MLYYSTTVLLIPGILLNNVYKASKTVVNSITTFTSLEMKSVSTRDCEVESTLCAEAKNGKKKKVIEWLLGYSCTLVCTVAPELTRGGGG